MLRVTIEEGREAARLWARLTGGLGRSQEEAGDWVDLDEESLGSEDSEVETDPKLKERERRIKKGRVARATARDRLLQEKRSRTVKVTDHSETVQWLTYLWVTV